MAQRRRPISLMGALVPLLIGRDEAISVGNINGYGQPARNIQSLYGGHEPGKPKAFRSVLFCQVSYLCDEVHDLRNYRASPRSIGLTGTASASRRRISGHRCNMPSRREKFRVHDAVAKEGKPKHIVRLLSLWLNPGKEANTLQQAVRNEGAPTNVRGMPSWSAG